MSLDFLFLWDALLCLQLRTEELFLSISLVPWITTLLAKTLLVLALLGGSCPG